MYSFNCDSMGSTDDEVCLVASIFISGFPRLTLSHENNFILTNCCITRRCFGEDYCTRYGSHDEEDKEHARKQVEAVQARMIYFEAYKQATPEDRALLYLAIIIVLAIVFTVIRSGWLVYTSKWVKQCCGKAQAGASHKGEHDLSPAVVEQPREMTNMNNDEINENNENNEIINNPNPENRLAT